MPSNSRQSPCRRWTCPRLPDVDTLRGGVQVALTAGQGVVAGLWDGRRWRGASLDVGDLHIVPLLQALRESLRVGIGGDFDVVIGKKIRR